MVFISFSFLLLGTARIVPARCKNRYVTDMNDFSVQIGAKLSVIRY